MSFPSDDRYVRFTFADSKRVAGLLREFLPQSLLQSLDLDRLKRIHDNHIRESMAEVRDDLSLECPMIPAGTVLIRILVEHKSDHAPGLWLQLMKSFFTEWERNNFAPTIPVIIHTGLKPFWFESPQSRMSECSEEILKSVPTFQIYPIDLAICTKDRNWKSSHLDHVSKVALSILRLVQEKQLDIGEIKRMLREKWPGVSELRYRRHVRAAMYYLRFKSDYAREHFQELITDMKFAHSINPNSLFAQELREEHQKGLEEGLEKGLERGIERGLELDKIQVIQSLLANGFDWNTIQKITSLDQQGYEALLAKHGAA